MESETNLGENPMALHWRTTGEVVTFEAGPPIVQSGEEGAAAKVIGGRIVNFVMNQTVTDLEPEPIAPEPERAPSSFSVSGKPSDRIFRHPLFCVFVIVWCLADICIDILFLSSSENYPQILAEVRLGIFVAGCFLSLPIAVMYLVILCKMKNINENKNDLFWKGLKLDAIHAFFESLLQSIISLVAIFAGYQSPDTFALHIFGIGVSIFILHKFRTDQAGTSHEKCEAFKYGLELTMSTMLSATICSSFQSNTPKLGSELVAGAIIVIPPLFTYVVFLNFAFLDFAFFKTEYAWIHGGFSCPHLLLSSLLGMLVLSHEKRQVFIASLIVAALYTLYLGTRHIAKIRRSDSSGSSTDIGETNSSTTNIQIAPT